MLWRIRGLHKSSPEGLRKFTREIPLGVEEEATIPHETPWVTYTIIAINTVVYLITSASNAFIETSDTWSSILGFTPAELFSNPLLGLLRIFAAMFTHANIVHIFFNMYFLYLFGRAVERTLGHGRYFILYIVSGIMAAVVHSIFMYALSPSGLAIPSIGASGAISGVLGAYMVLYPGTRLAACFFLFYIPICFELAAGYYLLFWFALQVYMGYLMSSSSTVAFFAHAGGFVTGIALLPLIASRTRLTIIRLHAASRRLWGLIIFYPMTYIRRALSPQLKIILSMLITLLLMGSLYSLAAAEKDSTYITEYHLIVSLPQLGVKYSGNFYVSIDPQSKRGALLAQTISYNPILVAPVKLLVEKNLLYNPELHGTYTFTPGKSILRITQPLSEVFIIDARKMYATYDSLGLLTRGKLEGTIVKFTLTPSPPKVFTVNIERVGLNMVNSIVPLYAGLATVIILVSLYTVLLKDRDLVITPE
jgi:membrane associated rhomboid family serine protease